jgi:DNA (cytosine-5)-methyltransferase 1
MEIIRTTSATIGTNKNQPRIYINGKYLAEAGFTPGASYQIQDNSGSFTLIPSEDGDRTVSSKKNGTVPVIDINAAWLRDVLGEAESVEIVTRYGEINVSRAYVERKADARAKSDAAVALFAGGGMLCQAAEDAGYRTVAAVEVDSRYADIWQSNHDGHMVNQPIQEVDFAALAETINEPVGLMTIGIPCTPFSTARRNAKGKNDAPAEAHELGDMFFWALKAVDALNPYTIVIENVVGFEDSVAGLLTRTILGRMGYTIDAKVVHGPEFGYLGKRSRYVIVATMDETVVWPEESSQKTFFGEILHDADDDRCDWFSREDKAWLFNHWDRQTAKGNGFASQILTEDTRICPTIKKRYFAQQGDNPVVAHPTKPGLYRWLTLDEVKVIMGLPEDYDLGTAKTTAGEILGDLGTAKTTAGEILGQGVVVGLFTQIIKASA